MGKKKHRDSFIRGMYVLLASIENRMTTTPTTNLIHHFTAQSIVPPSANQY